MLRAMVIKIKSSRYTCRMKRGQVLGMVLFALAACLGALPLWLQRWLGSFFGRVAHRFNVREAKVARRNLEIIQPTLDAGKREQLVRDILQATGRNTLETLRVWTRSRAANLRLVREIHGQAHLDAALAMGRGLIIAAPHYG